MSSCNQKKSENSISGEELGNKLLKSIKEMKSGKMAQATQIAPNEVAVSRLKTGLSQADFAKVLHRGLDNFREDFRSAESILS